MTLEIGMVLPERRTAELGVADYVRYQGASGDLNPVHHDPEQALLSGQRSIFCPGMLSAGLLGTYLADTIGPLPILDIGFSFREIVWPGEALTLRATVVSLTDDPTRPKVSFALECVRSDGSVAVTGDATCLLEQPS